jgi:capsular polysaccharide biosynthesis protein
MTKTQKVSIQVQPFTCGEKRLFTAKSYLIDRVVPDIEQVLLPATSTKGGQVNFWWSNSETTHLSNSASRKEKLRAEMKNKFRPVRLTSSLLIDLRTKWPDNWAHVLSNHLPLACFIRDSITLEHEREVTVLLDSSSPQYIISLFKMFKFKVFKNSGRVTGNFVNLEVEPWICIRSVAFKWIQKYFHNSSLKDDIFSGIEQMPSKVFLNRKKTRSARNQSELSGFLSALGYVTIFPEDLSPQKQLKLFADAEHVVAIHGAGAAPLLYRDINQTRLKFVEILSPGHMTNYYRIMADQVGALWVGVRGRIEPKHLKLAYSEDQVFRRYSLSSFFVDTESLQAALGSIENKY